MFTDIARGGEFEGELVMYGSSCVSHMPLRSGLRGGRVCETIGRNHSAQHFHVGRISPYNFIAACVSIRQQSSTARGGGRSPVENQ